MNDLFIENISTGKKLLKLLIVSDIKFSTIRILFKHFGFLKYEWRNDTDFSFVIKSSFTDIIYYFIIITKNK